MKDMKTSGGSRLLSAALALSLLAGCGGPAATESAAPSVTSAPEAAEAKTVELVDLMGNQVEVPSPENLESIAITSWMGGLTAAILLGQLDKVKVMCDTRHFSWLRHTFPELADIPDYGAFEDVNVEELLQSGAQVVISPSTSPNANQKMRTLGITMLEDGVMKDNSTDVFRQMYDEIDLMAALTGTTDVAERYYEWADSTYAMVNERVKDIPEDERCRVVPVREDITQVFGNNCIWGYVVEMAGGKNLSGDITANTGKFFVDVDPEQLVAWNPDYIFQSTSVIALDEVTAEKYNNWAADERYQDIPALRDGEFYLEPVGMDYWGSVTEAPLCVLWMASIMYPERFEDIDVKAYAAQFYEDFVGCTLTDEDWALMAPQYNGAKPNGLSQPAA